MGAIREREMEGKRIKKDYGRKRVEKKGGNFM
jgi:hypothetical protein